MGLESQTADDDDLADDVSRSDFADDLVDELVPEGLEWRRLVETYPISAVSMATFAGFLLGRNHGTMLLTAISAFMAKEMSRNILTVLDGESGDATERRR